MKVISQFRRLKHVNFSGNHLDYTQLFELYLTSFKYLKSFNNQPLGKNPKKDFNEFEKKMKSNKMIENSKKKSRKSRKNDEISSEREDKNNEILFEKTIVKEKKEKLKEVIKNQPLPIQKKIKKNDQKLKQSKIINEKIKKVLSKGDEKISKWE